MNVSVCGGGDGDPLVARGKLHCFSCTTSSSCYQFFTNAAWSSRPPLALQPALQVTLAGLCLATSCSLPPPLMSLHPPTVARKHRLATFPQSHKLLFSLEPSIFIHLQSWRACREVIADELLTRIARMLFTLQVCINHMWTHLENCVGRIDPKYR